MVDIQNATLAGGVAIGSCADMPIGPAAALAIGCLAGSVSTYGFARIQRRVEQYIGVHDTCGVLNLHGIPAVIAGISSSVATAALSSQSPASLAAVFPAIEAGRSFSVQASYQAAYLLITIVHAIISGSVVGNVAKFVSPYSEYYLDEESWMVPERENPYYFDSRGEVERAGSGVAGATGSSIADIEKRLMDLERNFPLVSS